MSKRVKKPVAPRKKANGYKMPAPIPLGEVIVDAINKKKWRIGPSIGVGGFGEIYSACDDGGSPKKTADFPFVIKIEPHENGPLFVEKHFYVRNANKEDITAFMKQKKLSSLGMPMYFGNGSHMCNGEKYRYLVLERYGKDVWSLFKDNGRVFPPATVFQIGLQMLDVLEYIHGRGYMHADIKGANILLGLKKGTENQAYLVDFGLATRINEKDFKPDPKCAHNGTIEYTSRDAHLGSPTMRGDLEILGYNMLQWIVSELPWENNLKDPKTVQDKKETFMKQARSEIAKFNHDVPEALINFFEYINTIKPKDTPDYAKCRRLFETYLKSENKTRNSKLDFSINKKKTKVSGDTNGVDKTDKTKNNKKNEPNGNIIKPKRGRKPKETKVEESDNENENPDYSMEIVPPRVRRNVKRKSTEPVVVVKVKKTKMIPKKTPPPKSFVNISTQTSVEKRNSSHNIKQVSFDSPVCAVIDDSNTLKTSSINSSGDIFEDSFVIEEQKVKPKRRLLAKKEITVTRVVKKKVTKQKGKTTVAHSSSSPLST